MLRDGQLHANVARSAEIAIVPSLAWMSLGLGGSMLIGGVTPSILISGLHFIQCQLYVCASVKGVLLLTPTLSSIRNVEGRREDGARSG